MLSKKTEFEIKYDRYKNIYEFIYIYTLEEIKNPYMYSLYIIQIRFCYTIIFSIQ